MFLWVYIALPGAIKPHQSPIPGASPPHRPLGVPEESVSGDRELFFRTGSKQFCHREMTSGTPDGVAPYLFLIFYHLLSDVRREEKQEGIRSSTSATSRMNFSLRRFIQFRNRKERTEQYNRLCVVRSICRTLRGRLKK